MQTKIRGVNDLITHSFCQLTRVIVTLLVTDFYFEGFPRLNEIFLKHVIQGRVKVFSHIFNKQRSTQGQAVF